MRYFNNDYNEVCHPAILKALAENAGVQMPGYSADSLCAEAADLIRKKCDARVSERALREIYLKGFEICVKESDPKTVMTSYNLINGVWASESADLQTWILRGEWGFDGLIMTDWNGHGRHGTELKAGSDIKMMTDNQGQLTNYLRDDYTGGMFRGDIEAAARRILKVFLWYEGIDVE
jgi:beta-glucosidase